MPFYFINLSPTSLLYISILLLLVLDSVTSAPQCIRQPRPRVYLKEGTYHTRLFRGPAPLARKGR